MTKSILFLCARRTLRAHMAASILASKGGNQWNIWSTPAQNTQGRTLIPRVLEEAGIPLLEVPQITEPLFDLHWDEGIILCSGMAAT